MILFAKKVLRDGDRKTFVKEVTYVEDESGYSLLDEQRVGFLEETGSVEEELLALVGQKVRLVFSDYTEKTIIVGKTKFRPDDDECRVFIYAA